MNAIQFPEWYGNCDTCGEPATRVWRDVGYAGCEEQVIHSVPLDPLHRSCSKHTVDSQRIPIDECRSRAKDDPLANCKCVALTH